MTFLKKICPVCAITALTWLVMLTFKLLGYAVNTELLAMLMGGSVVGISYTLGAHLQPIFGRSVVMYWKLVTVPLGFMGMYAILQFKWWYATGVAVAYALVWAGFNGMYIVSKKEGQRVRGITKALDTCCE